MSQTQITTSASAATTAQNEITLPRPTWDNAESIDGGKLWQGEKWEAVTLGAVVVIARRMAADDKEPGADITSIVVAITNEQYWGKGADVERALEQCRKAGASGSQNVLIYAYRGAPEKLAEVGVNSFGDVEYPKGVTSTRIGMIKLNVNQPKFKK